MVDAWRFFHARVIIALYPGHSHSCTSDATSKDSIFAAFTPDAKVAGGSHTVTVNEVAMAHVMAIHGCESVDDLISYAVMYPSTPMFPDFGNPFVPPTSATVKTNIQALMRAAGCDEKRVSAFHTYSLRNLALAALCASGTPLPIILSCMRWTRAEQLVRYFNKDAQARHAWLCAHKRVYGYTPSL